MWVYVGYPIVLGLGRAAAPEAGGARPTTPDVSLVICAYNEERDIRRKLEECLAADYPAERLEIIVASDGSTDRTDDIVREFAPRVHAASASRAGAARRSRRTPPSRWRAATILVFSDVTTVYTPAHDPRDGRELRRTRPSAASAATSTTRRSRANTSAEGRALFWGYERQLRVWESQVHSIIGVARLRLRDATSLYVPLDHAGDQRLRPAGRASPSAATAPCSSRARSRSSRSEAARSARSSIAARASSRAGSAARSRCRRC